MRTIAFRNDNIRTAKDSYVLKLIKLNKLNITEVGMIDDPDYLISNFEPYGFLNKDKKFYAEEISHSKCWRLFNGDKKVNEEELFDLFQQFLSNDVASSKLGADLLYSLDGNLYYEIQYFITYYCRDISMRSIKYNIFTELCRCDTKLELTKNIPFRLLEYINYEYNNKNVEIFIPFCNKVFNAYQICENKYIKLNPTITSKSNERADFYL